jgi:hypothetical protein
VQVSDDVITEYQVNMLATPDKVTAARKSARSEEEAKGNSSTPTMSRKACGRPHGPASPVAPHTIFL